MKSFDELDAKVDFLFRNHLPKTVCLFMSKEELKETKSWLTEWANGASLSFPPLSKTSLDFDRLIYAGYTFIIAQNPTT